MKDCEAVWMSDEGQECVTHLLTSHAHEVRHSSTGAVSRLPPIECCYLVTMVMVELSRRTRVIDALGNFDREF